MLLFCLKISKKIIPTAGLGLRFLFALKIDSLTSTNSFIKRFVKNKNSEITHRFFCQLLELNCNLLNNTDKDDYENELSTSNGKHL
jgi:hypothetical protein